MGSESGIHLLTALKDFQGSNTTYAGGALAHAFFLKPNSVKIKIKGWGNLKVFIFLFVICVL